MEEQIQNNNIRLRRISTLNNDGNKLDTTNNDIEIYEPGLVSWVRRKFKGDGPQRCVPALRKFYKEACLINDQAMKNPHQDYTHLLDSAWRELHCNVTGLSKLRQHYLGDANAPSDIDSIIKDIVMPHINKLELYLKSKGVNTDNKKPIDYLTNPNTSPTSPPSPTSPSESTPLLHSSSPS